MKYSEELSKLIIDNVAQHERAAQVLEEIDKTVLKAIEVEAKAVIERFDSELDGNEDFELYENGKINFSFKNWKVEGSDESIFILEINDISENDEGSDTWLGHICGIPYTSTALRLQFYVDYRELGLKAHRYKQILRETFETSSPLIERGFKLSDSGYGLEKAFQFKKEEILAHYPSDLSESMLPLTNVLESFEECKAEFDKLVEVIKSR